MRRVLAEPLLHFVVLGALLFAAYALLADRTREPATIVVGPGQVDAMAAVFERTWRRAPTQEELTALIDGYVREEVLYREGVAQGLDRDDQLIRRRVAQKVEFLAESGTALPEPDTAALQAYLDAHGERYALPALLTFRQVYLGTATRADAASLLVRLEALGDSDAAEHVGQATQLAARMERASPADIARAFGRRFGEVLAATRPGAWQGPVASDYGLHLVRVTERVDTRVPLLDEVRDAVRRDWLRDTEAAAKQRRYEALRARYAVRIEPARGAPAQ